MSRAPTRTPAPAAARSIASAGPLAACTPVTCSSATPAAYSYPTARIGGAPVVDDGARHRAAVRDQLHVVDLGVVGVVGRIERAVQPELGQLRLGDLGGAR